MPILTALLAVVAVSVLPQGFPPFEKVEPFTLTKDARQEMREAMCDFLTGDRAYARAEIRGLLLNQTPSIGLEDRTENSAPIRQAVETWQRLLSETPFRSAQPTERPDVVVRLVSQIDGGDDDQGEVTFGSPADEPDGRFHAEILVLKTYEGRPIAPQEEQAVVTHELGHVLGLEDSEDGTGIMGTFAPDDLVLAPTPIETLAVAELRSDLRKTLRAISG